MIRYYLIVSRETIVIEQTFGKKLKIYKNDCFLRLC